MQAAAARRQLLLSTNKTNQMSYVGASNFMQACRLVLFICACWMLFSDHVLCSNASSMECFSLCRTLRHKAQISDACRRCRHLVESKEHHPRDFSRSLCSSRDCHGVWRQRRQLADIAELQSRPAPPVNLSHGDVTLVANGKVSVTVQWQSPQSSNACRSVDKYKVFWSKRWSVAAHHVTLSVKQNYDVTPGNQTRITISPLDRDATYHVQVQALCLDDDEQSVNSRKAGIHIQTSLKPPSAFRRTLQYEENTIQNTILPPSIETIFTDTPFYQNGLLKANITWTFNTSTGSSTDAVDRVMVTWVPDWCSVHPLEPGVSLAMSTVTQEDFFTAFDLRFDCRYTVKIQPITSQGVLGPVAVTSLMTPSCSIVMVVGTLKPDCVSAVRLIDEPINVQYFFIINGLNMAANITWTPPFTDMSITGYQVIWNQLLSDGSRATTYSRIVSKDARSVSLTGLSESTTYVVHVQALSKYRPGLNASLQFSTPKLHIQPTVVTSSTPDDASTTSTFINSSNTTTTTTLTTETYIDAFVTQPPKYEIDYIIITSSMTSSSATPSSAAVVNKCNAPRCLFIALLLLLLLTVITIT